MKVNRIIAATVVKRTNRVAGMYKAALELTVDDKTGVAVFEYGWDKRDVTAETLYVEPAMQEAVKAACGDDGLSAFFGFGSAVGDPAAIEEAEAKATALVYEMP